MARESISVGARRLDVENLDKVIFPTDGITQGELLDYYLDVADVMLPFLRHRPVSLQRFPNGIDQPGFYQKEAPEYFPAWIHRVEVKVKEGGRAQSQVVCNDAATLAYLVDQGVVTLHTWLSREPELGYPDTLVFDLDPPGDNFPMARKAAFLMRNLLDELFLPGNVMTTGSRGLHVRVPLDGSTGFNEVRAFAKECAQVLVTRHPELLTTELRKDARGERVFVDYLRNTYAQTSVPPYTVRARPGAPVATPITWDELGDDALTARTYTIRTIADRIRTQAPPWREATAPLLEFGSVVQRLRQLQQSA